MPTRSAGPVAPARLFDFHPRTPMPSSDACSIGYVVIHDPEFLEAYHLR